MISLSIAGCGGSSAPTLPPLDFGQVPVGRTVTRRVLLPEGAATAVAADAPRLILRRLDPEEAIFELVWRPTRPGAIEGQLQFVDAEGLLVATAPVAGLARAPEVEVWPRPARFGPRGPGEARSASVWVWPETDVEITVAEGGAWPLCPRAPTCVRVLADRAQDGLPAHFELSLAADAAPPGPLALATCTDPACSFEVEVEAPEPSGNLSCSPARLELPAAAVGRPAEVTVSCEGGPFTATVQHPELTVTRLSDSAVTVRWIPQAPGRLAATLSVGAGHPPLPISGYSLTAPDCALAVDPEPAVFGLAPVGQSSQVTLHATNRGVTDCLLAALEAAPAPAFAFAPRAPIWLAPGTSLQAELSFSPDEARPYEGQARLRVPSEDGSVLVPLYGEGVAADLSVDRETIDFGDIDECGGQFRSLTVLNRGGAPGWIDLVEAIGPDGDRVRVLGGVPAEIPPGGSHEVRLQMLPGPEGPLGATVQLRLRSQTGTARAEVTATGRAVLRPQREDHFEQRRAPMRDLLFVIDDGPGLAQAQDYMRESLAGITRYGPLDLRVAVIADSVSDPARAGRLLPVGDPAAQVVSSETSTDIEADVAALLGHVGTTSSTQGQGLAATLLALGDGTNGFRRREASLDVLVFTTRDDASPMTTSGFAARFQGAGTGDAPRATLSVIGGPVGGCAGEGVVAEAAPRYLDVANRTGGFTGSICDRSWTQWIVDPGPAPSSLESRFFMSSPAVPDSVEVLVEGQPVPPLDAEGRVQWTYNDVAVAVDFSPFGVPGPGAQITVRYRAGCVD